MKNRQLKILSSNQVLFFGTYATVAFLVPLLVSNVYYLDVLIKSTYFLTMAVSLSVIIGHLGMLSLAHPAFFGIGAYTSALLSAKLHVPVLLSMPLAALTGGLIAMLVGFPLMKLTYHAFAIGTLAFLIIMRVVAANWIDLTRGPLCLSGLSRPSIEIGSWSYSFNSDASNYYVILVIATLTIIVTALVINSRFGRALNAIRNDEPLAASAGVNPYKYKIQAFSLAAVFPALAGAFYVHYMTVVCPKIIDFHYVIYLLIMVIIGGASSLTGVVLAAYLFTYLPEALRIATEYRDLAYGILLTIFVIYMPGGIWPQMERWLGKLKRSHGVGYSQG